MNSHDLQDILRDLIEDEGLTDDLGDRVLRRVETYEESGVLTRDAGLVLRTLRGDEFQISIVQSRGCGE